MKGSKVQLQTYPSSHCWPHKSWNVEILKNAHHLGPQEEQISGIFQEGCSLPSEIARNKWKYFLARRTGRGVPKSSSWMEYCSYLRKGSDWCRLNMNSFKEWLKQDLDHSAWGLLGVKIPEFSCPQCIKVFTFMKSKGKCNLEN